MNLGLEIKEIGRLISSATLVMAVRNEVAAVMKEGFVVTDGRHCPTASGYEIIVRCGESSATEVSRRVKANVSNIDVDKIAEGVLGIRTARRGKL
jgi:hypothetical protein